MPRTSTRRGLTGIAVAAAMLLSAAPAAGARASAPILHLTHAPRVVGWHATARIRGWLENGVPDMEVALQSRTLNHRFHEVQTKSVGADNRVSFTIRHARRTRDYRLVSTTGSGDRISSRVNRVRVRAAAGLHLSRSNVFAGRRVVLRGHVYPATSGRSVVVQQRVRGAWHNIASPSVGDGSFRLRWRPKHKGHRRVRVRFSGDAYNVHAKKSRHLRVYVKDPATWYGPGFYGHRTACGRRLTRRTMGVANRHLPCGTQVSFMYHGNVVTVPVIDRGPYSRADWDLTRAAARRLSFSGSDRVGTTR